MRVRVAENLVPEMPIVIRASGQACATSFYISYWPALLNMLKSLKGMDNRRECGRWWDACSDAVGEKECSGVRDWRSRSRRACLNDRRVGSDCGRHGTSCLQAKLSGPLSPPWHPPKIMPASSAAAALYFPTTLTLYTAVDL